MPNNHGPKNLSPREREVALLAAQGLIDREIADRIGVSSGTLRTYWDRARQKMDAKSRAHVIALLLRDEYEDPRQDHLDMARLFILSSADFAVIVADAEGLFSFWNPGIQTTLGYAEHEWLGEHISIIYTPEQRAAGLPEQEMAQVREEGPLVQLGWHMKNGDERFWARGTLFALWDGELRGYGKILRAEAPPKDEK